MLTIFILDNIDKDLKKTLKLTCQAVNSKIYVGCISARIREEIWQEIEQNNSIRDATIIHAVQNHVIIKTKGTQKVQAFDLVDLIKIK